MTTGFRATSSVPYANRHGWLDHPRIAAHYRERAAIDGQLWEEWVPAYLGRPPARSLQLAAGAGTQSFHLFERGLAQAIDGIENSEDAVLTAERSREACRAPGVFHVGDVNAVNLPHAGYDLIFMTHALHQVVALERLLDQVYRALTPGGVFVVEGFLGPSRFQWTDAQMAVVAVVTSWLPEHLRMLRWGVPKIREGRADRSAVAAVATFDAMRSGEILPLIRDRFALLTERKLGGTIQHLLYNGIVHNFADDDPDANVHVDRAMSLEDTLIDAELLPSDFMLMVGKRR